MEKTIQRGPLRIKAVDLGGTNRDDSLVAANRWFEEQKALIDAQILQKRLHPQEEAYKAEQEEMKTAIKFLSKLKGADPEIESVIETLKEKSERIRQTPQNESTPPIDIHRRNPLHVSGQEIQDEADQTAFEELFAEGIEEYELFKNNRDWLESHALYTPAHVEGAMPEGIVCLSYDDYINNRFENDQWKDRKPGVDLDRLRKCFETTIVFAKRNGLLDSNIAFEDWSVNCPCRPRTKKKHTYWPEKSWTS